MIPSIVKIPASIAQQLVVGVARGGLGAAFSLLHRVLPGHQGEREARSGAQTTHSPDVDNAPRVSAEPVTQPPAPESRPTPGVTTTLADPAPATATPATRKTARRATARKGPATKAATKKPLASSTAAQKAVAKKTPARKVVPTKPAATLDEPAAPVDDDPVVYSSGPDPLA